MSMMRAAPPSAVTPPGPAGEPTVEAVRRQLRKVVDPCSLAVGAPVDIEAMGLVEDVAIANGVARVSLVLTDVTCVFWRDLRRHVADVLLALPGVEVADVTLVTDLLWTPDRRKEP
jgi:metal-sulfur cluster biosynthetic enzyme